MTYNEPILGGLMNRLLVIFLPALLLLGFVALSHGQAGGLKVGDRAPEFQMQGSDGKVYSLSQFKGKKGVVIAWYPKAFTGG